MQPFWLTELCAEDCREWFIIKQYEENFNLYQIQIWYPGKDVIYLCGNKKQRILLGEWFFSCSVWSDSLQSHGLSMPGSPVLHHIPQFAQTHVPWVSDAIQLSHPLSSPPVLNLSQHQGLFQWVSYSHQVAKGLELQLQYSPFNEYSGLVSFRIEWFDLLAVQRILKSLLQHDSSKASVLQHSDLSIVQFSHPYITTGKTIAFTIRTLVRKVMSLLFNTLSRIVITFLPRSKCLLISCLHSPSAVILEPKKIKSATVSIVSPSICQKVMGLISQEHMVDM